jgi:photosystem II stability/assembly factor-like uncharacterized protein
MEPRATRVFVGAGHWVSGGRRHPGGLFRRSPGDGDWQALTTGLPENVEARAFAAHPREPDVLYVGTQDGPYRTTDGGAHWERLGFPDRGAVVWSLAFHPKRPEIMYAGVAPIAIYRSEDGGDTWRRLPKAVQPDKLKMSFACRVMRIGIVPGQPDQIHAALEVGGTMRSLDGGETWQDGSADLVKLAEDNLNLKSMIQSDSEAEGMLDAHALAVSSAAPSSVFLAVRMGLFRSDDRGQSWQDMEINRFSPLTYGRDIRVSPHDPRTLFAALSPAARSRDGSLYRSTDLGRTWSRIDHGVKADATMMALALHPRDPKQIYGVSRCAQVFGTQDGGTTWRESRLPEGVQDVYALACA